ncbi:hypothetical protein ERJ75_000814600 [Trypanosoma vivax]|nr:hypothetical protein ERJ75_000814600 [Trypanosoma vivax]
MRSLPLPAGSWFAVRAVPLLRTSGPPTRFLFLRPWGNACSHLRAAPSSCFRRHTGDSAAQSEASRRASVLRAASYRRPAGPGTVASRSRVSAQQRARCAIPASRHQGRATPQGKGTGLCGEACPVHARTAQCVIGNGGNARFADRVQRAGARSRTRVAGTGRRKAFPQARSLGRGGKTLSATMGGAGESTLGGSEGRAV